MATREQFQKELEGINEEVTELAKMAGDALNSSIQALFNQDKELAEQVIKNDRNIDQLEEEINDKAILLIARQAPVATDLRRTIIALKIVTDLERMGDNAKNIARATLDLSENFASVPQSLNHMHEHTIEMLNATIVAFKEEDATIAGKLEEMDDKVDKLYRQIISELLGETATNPDKVQYVMQVALCARYIERFADHITNLGENIVYLVKGEKYNY